MSSPDPKRKALRNAFVLIPDSISAEIMAHAGWDILTIDMQHGPISADAALGLCQIIATTPTEPWVRLPWLTDDHIQRALDMGARGIICPMVESAEQVARLVRASLYPPRGHRSFGPIRPLITEGLGYRDRANVWVRPIAMIETAAALASVEDIAAVDGLWGVYVGPTDLSLSLGLDLVAGWKTPQFDAALTRIARAARSNGVRLCLHANTPDMARHWARHNPDVVTIASDFDLLKDAAQARLAETS